MMSPLWGDAKFLPTGRYETSNRAVKGTWEQFFHSFKRTKKNSRCAKCRGPLGTNIWHRVIRGKRYHQKCAPEHDRRKDF